MLWVWLAIYLTSTFLVGWSMYRRVGGIGLLGLPFGYALAELIKINLWWLAIVIPTLGILTWLLWRWLELTKQESEKEREYLRDLGIID